MRPGPELDRWLMPLLAATVFASAATVHYQAPMLVPIATEFAASPTEIGLVPTLTFGGFFAGTLLLVPLGDRLDKRRLIVVQMVLLSLAMAAIAAAPTLPVLWAASLAGGVVGCVSQHVFALVAGLVPPAQRGAALGTTMSAVFVGILFGRIAGGLVAAAFGWRAMFVIAAALLATLAVALWFRLPASAPTTDLRWRSLLASLLELPRRYPALRRASAVQLLLAIGYGGFWATLAPMLAATHGLGPAAAGLFAIPGAAGILVARPAGRWMDRSGSRPVVVAGVAGVVAAFVLLASAPVSIVAIVAGAILLDCGLRASMVANQTLVASVDASARGRSNTVFAAHMWGGNALGAFLASAALDLIGWLAVCGLAIAAAGVAMWVEWRARP